MRRRVGAVLAAGVLALALFVPVHGTRAAPVSPAVRAEIDALLTRLESSGCAFSRNGAWHGASEARAHLLRKLEYLEGRSLVRTTEQFIERAASASSVSGKPYLVKCGQGEAIPSATWLATELRYLRAPGGDANPR